MSFRASFWPGIVCGVVIMGCNGSSGPNVTGSGVASVEQRTVPSFRAVELYGVGALTANSGGETALTIEADDNMLQYVRSSVESETLRVGVGSGTYVWNTGYPRITLNGANVASYKLGGQTQLVLSEAELDELNLTLDGQCNATVTGKISNLTISVTGQCTIDVSGASIIAISGSMSGQSTLICSDAADVKVEKNGDSLIRTVGPE